MKKTCILAACLVYPLYGETSTLRKYLVDPDIATILDRHTKEIYRKLKKIDSTHLKKHGVWQFGWLPDYYVKYGLARIYGMEKMRRAITKHNLTTLRVPDKMVYHLKGRPTSPSSLNYAVIIKKVNAPKKRIPLTQDDVEQLVALINETGYVSLTRSNYIKTHEGPIYMIDTESTFDYSRRIIGLMQLISTHNLNTDFTPDALKFIFKEITRAIDKEAGGHYTKAQKFIKLIKGKKNRQHAWDYVSYYKQLIEKRYGHSC